jgi:hypothetical protein
MNECPPDVARSGAGAGIAGWSAFTSQSPVKVVVAVLCPITEACVEVADRECAHISRSKRWRRCRCSSGCSTRCRPPSTPAIRTGCWRNDLVLGRGVAHCQIVAHAIRTGCWRNALVLGRGVAHCQIVAIAVIKLELIFCAGGGSTCHQVYIVNSNVTTNAPTACGGDLVVAA